MKRNDLRNEILDLEPYPEDLKLKISEAIAHTTERPMKSWERPIYVLGCVVLGGGAIWKIGRAFAYGDFGADPLHYLVVLPAGILMLLGALALTLYNLKRGSTLPRMEILVVYVAVVFVLGVAVKNILITGEFDIKALGALVIAGLVGIYVRNEANTLVLREQALKNELALAELKEMVAERRDE